MVNKVIASQLPMIALTLCKAITGRNGLSVEEQ